LAGLQDHVIQLFLDSVSRL
jgi:hypothetical protein